jgi:hypothetical protein
MQQRCPRDGCGHPRAEHDLGPCDDGNRSSHCACYQFGSWTPAASPLVSRRNSLRGGFMLALEAEADLSIPVAVIARDYTSVLDILDHAGDRALYGDDGAAEMERVRALFLLRTGMTDAQWHSPAATAHRQAIREAADALRRGPLP